MLEYLDVLREALRPPSRRERLQLAIMQLDLAIQAIEAGDLTMAREFLRDARAHAVVAQKEADNG